MGNRLDHTAFYRNDGKIFTKRNRPNDEIELSVGVLVDMSGSMSSERIRMAQAMALIVHDFCQSLHIPVTVPVVTLIYIRLLSSTVWTAAIRRLSSVVMENSVFLI